MIWLTYFMSLLMIYGLNTWLPKFMTEAGFPLGSSLSFLLALNVGATVGAILMGWVADRWGVGKSLILFFLIAIVSITSLGLCNKYDSIVCYSSHCRSCNCWNTKPYTFLYFAILSGYDAFNSTRMGIRGWTDWRNTWDQLLAVFYLLQV